MGLTHAGCKSPVATYLGDTLEAAQGEIVQHGAALGPGVVAMGSKSTGIFEDLKTVLFMDFAHARG